MTHDGHGSHSFTANDRRSAVSGGYSPRPWRLWYFLRMTQPTSRPLDGAERVLLDAQRERAERLLNGVRAIVLLLLASAAFAYAPALSPALNRVNIVVLVPMLLWTAAQYLLFYRRSTLPEWLSIVNPIVDILGVTVIVGGYGVAASAALALKSPIVLAYFVILAGRPIASSTRRAAAASVLVVVSYASLVGFFVLSGRTPTVSSPIVASSGGTVALLDEGAKLLLLAVAGAVATYATAWHERLATSYSRESRERESLQVRLAESQLRSLKLQLHPHFLFNTLNTITALVHTDPQAAEQMISGLSELLRTSLHSAAEPEVSLDRELETLGHYVAIQQLRFNDRLRVTTSIDAAACDALVPSLLLQPLVENAIRHGIAPRAAPGCVEVSASVESGMLRVQVSDNGVGMRGGTAESIREGVGLGNTRARLQHLYAERHTMQVESPVTGGFTIRISLPYTPAPARVGA